MLALALTVREVVLALNTVTTSPMVNTPGGTVILPADIETCLPASVLVSV